MPEFPIKLGRKMDGPPGMAVAVKTDEAEAMHYPTLYLEWEEPYELPESGTLTVKYRTLRNGHDKKAGKYTEDLEIVEIVSAKGSKDKKRKQSTDESGEALDKIKAEMDEDSDEDSDEY